MRSQRLSASLRLALVILATTTFAIGTCAAEVLYSFHNKPTSPDGKAPTSSLILGSDGNLYGTASGGGPDKVGVVFEVMFNGDGTWTEKVLHSFDETDGGIPYAGLISDVAGNLYGTTRQGGAHKGGTAYELMPNGDGSWTEVLLHSFFEESDGGSEPNSGLIFDPAGNLYGTTLLGTSTNGNQQLGTVFELKNNGDGTWTEKVLHRFNADDKHGYFPYAGLVFDTAGNLYGTTFDGDLNGVTAAFGTVFELMPTQAGSWTYKLLHRFKADGKDGFNPYAGLVIDTAGNLYGTTYNGGSPGFGGGTVFELTPNIDGTWAEKILHRFKGGSDGDQPRAGLTFDASGNLYGTTVGGGTDDIGTVFELSPGSGGKWTETVLHKFKNDSNDGNAPYGGVILDSNGNLFGTTVVGGAHGGGTVFEFTH